MIPRYEIEEISSIWSLDSKLNYFLRVELSLLSSLIKHQVIPESTKSIFSKKIKIDVNRSLEIEKVVKHDVIAFTSMISEQLEDHEAKYFHFGVTSSDIIDSALSLQIKDSLEILVQDFEAYLKSLRSLIEKSEDILAIGRSHGIYAEPLILAQKFLSFYAEGKRGIARIKSFIKNDLRAQFSGAVGNYTVLTPEIEQDACKDLGLEAEEVSTQIIPRDRISFLISLITQLASSFERFAIELRHLQHSDLSEVYEGFSEGQKGSSTMPHKKNPISAENISGLARVVRSHHQIAVDNNLLWHERDISHSSAERIYLPDSLGLIVYMTRRMTKLINGLVLDSKIIEEKAIKNQSCLSSYYLHQLLLTSNLSRDEIYKKIQKISFEHQENFSDHMIKEFPELKSIDFNQLKNRYKTNYLKVKKRVMG